MFLKIAVGEKYNLVKNPEMYKGYESSVMEMANNGALSITLFLPNMTKSEVEIFKKNKIKVRVVEKENMLVTYIQYVGSNLTFELVFDPEKYPDNRMELFNKKNLIEIISVDTMDDMKVKSLRVVTAPFKLQELWEKSWKTDYSSYDNWVTELQNQNLMSIWNKAKYVGKFGE